MLIDVPVDEDGVNTHPAAVPAFAKSLAAIPETDSVNVIPSVRDIDAAGDVGVDDTVAPGGSTSMFIVVDAVAIDGPVCSVLS